MDTITSKAYIGNKGSFGSFQHIINHFPPHKLFISLCAGSGAVERRKLKAEMNIAVEITSAVTDKFDYASGGYHIVNMDCETWVHSNKHLLLPERKDNLIYMDPPYRLAARRSGREYYQNEWDDKKHARTLELLMSMPSLIVISHYEDQLYNSILKEWYKHSWRVMTHKGPVMECIYMNFAPPKELHQYNYLGEDFTDRQRIKRKKERFLNKLKNMPDLERYALLAVLKEFTAG